MIAKPFWLRRPVIASEMISRTRKLLRETSAKTICETANCPNLCECFNKGVATFIILGDVCTRGCRFCAVRHGRPLPPDAGEADKIRRAVECLGLKYAVITSVTRDDLEDGGAAHFASVVARLKDMAVNIGVEVLVPDFKASPDSIRTVHEAGVNVFAHNIDTVRRIHRSVKPRADYDVSLSVLRISKAVSPGTPTKSGIMLGLGETGEDVLESMKDLRRVDCDILTLGQYLKPAGGKIAESEFVSPNLFAKYEEIAYNLGFTRVSAGPFVRSSYYAACLNNI